MLSCNKDKNENPVLNDAGYNIGRGVFVLNEGTFTYANSSLSFFDRCGQIAKQVGFSWGGDWKSFLDRPHFQWDAHGKYTSSMILAGKYPPEMEEYMTQADFNKMMDAYLAQLRTKTVSTWAKDDWDKAKADKITDGTAPQGLITRQEVATMINRANTAKG